MTEDFGYESERGKADETPKSAVEGREDDVSNWGDDMTDDDSFK